MTGQQLKNSILQMAVQGKLVPQDPNDEPASVLLARIRKEKEELIKAGKIKKEKNPSYIFRGADNLPYEKVGKNESVCIADEVPFEIPESWEWAKIETISMPIGNKNNQIQSKEVLPTGKIPVVSQGKDLIDGYCNDVSKKIDVLPLVMFGDHTRNVKYIDFEFVIGADGTKFHKILSCNSEYIYYWMLYAAETLRNRGYARHYTLLKECFIPLPPLQEQVRIVSKIKAILPLVEKYGCEESKRVSLDSAFPNLLKKSILQEAIQGKLVPQDPGDEPASVLLERIRAEKQELIAEGKIKKDKHESVIFRRDNSHYEKQGSEEVCIDEELPFEVPKNWQWIRLSDLVHFIGGYAYKSETFIETSEYQALRLGNIKNDKIKYSTKPVFISKELSQKTVDFQCKTNDILLTMTGTRLKRDYFYTVLVSEKDTNCFINQRVGCLRSYLPSLSRWLIWTLKSEAILSQVFQHETGTANQGNLGAENIMKTFIPVPPLDEQERICNVIDRLLREVDTL